MSGPQIIIIAGPNGAGKTTFAKEFLTKEAHCPAFINADLIAAGLSPFQPDRAAIKAGRLMLGEINHAAERGESFAIETTLSGLGYSRKIPQWQDKGFHVSLFFLKLDEVEIAIERVAERVRQGGHNIPETVIRRRYKAGWENFQTIYSSLVNDWMVFNNSARQSKLLNWGENYE